MTPYYADGLVALFLGDCREVTEWLAADVLVTDPPYGIGWRRGKNAARGSKRHDGIAGDADTSVRDTALTLWGDRPGVVFGSFYAPPPRPSGTFSSTASRPTPAQSGAPRATAATLTPCS